MILTKWQHLWKISSDIKMKIKEFITNVWSKIKISKIYIYSPLIITFLFAIYNRVVGFLKESLWHESISIYYLLLLSIKTIIIVYIYKSKNRTKDKLIFRLTKVLLILLNILLIVPIVLMIFNQRIVQISLILSIAIALYVTIKTVKVIMVAIKKRKESDLLVRELRIIDLMDVILSILTLQNTLITVNSDGFDPGLFYLTIGSSIAGLIINLVFIFLLRQNRDKK